MIPPISKEDSKDYYNEFMILTEAPNDENMIARATKLENAVFVIDIESFN